MSSRNITLTAVAACALFLAGCPYHLEGDVYGTTPLVIVNNSSTRILGAKFWPPDKTEPTEYGTAYIEPGERRQFTVKPGPVAVLLVGEPQYRMAETQVKVVGPTELVVTATPLTSPATSGFTQVAVAPQAPPAADAAPAEDDDPSDCSKHGPCPLGMWCDPNGGPPDERGVHPPGCQPF